MSRLNILSKLEQKEFDTPPILSNEARKSLFRLSQSSKNYLQYIKKDENKISFILMYHYFKITRKFFVPQNFIMKDIEYVARQLGILDFKYRSIIDNLTKNSFKRYKLKILERTGFRVFDSSAKKLLYNKSSQLASNHVKPKIIYNDCIELLLNQKIEIPRYFSISEIIRSALGDYKRNILSLLSQVLTDNQKSLLDGLLTYSDKKEIYKLTKIKSLNYSTKPKAIRKNIDEFNRVKEIYNQHFSLIKDLPLNSKGVEYFATTVIKSDIFRVKRKSNNDRYLHLITFIIYQYSIIHDTLMDTFLKAIGSFNSSSKREHQLRCYEERIKFQVGLKEYLLKSQKENKALKEIYDLYKDKSKDISTKLERIGNILDKLYGNNSTLNITNVEILQFSNKSTEYYEILSEKSRSLQTKLSPILKSLNFDLERSSAQELLKAVEFFQQMGGKIPNIVPCIPLNFLSKEDKADVIISKIKGAKQSQYKINVPLYKVLLFKYIATEVKAGCLNLDASYKYKALYEYLISKDEWYQNKDALIKQAGFEQFKEVATVLADLEKVLNQEYMRTNENIIVGVNKYIKIRKINDYVLTTPALDEKENNMVSYLSDYFPDSYKVPMQEILYTIQEFRS